MSQFSYRATKDDQVFISFEGRDVTTLRGAAARRFLSRVDDADAGQAQQLMARATGNFKRGNERR
ncbi:MAG: hypothetical protein M3R70_08450 [Actinomycetota bacterium]|nr:hypothetical protein [Actinomycetota bacterium]